MPSTEDISIVIPTVDGRRDSLQRTLAAYEKETPGSEIIIISEYASCGDAWIAGEKLATRNYVHFTADDITPYPDWWQEAVHFLDNGVVPVCRIKKGYSSGRDEHYADVPCGELGTPRNVMVPFLTRDMLNSGGWLLPIHYGSDAWVSYWAVKNGYPVEVCPSYIVTHYLAPQGRVPFRQIGDMQLFITKMEESGYLPPFWETAKRKYGMKLPEVRHV